MWPIISLRRVSVCAAAGLLAPVASATVGNLYVTQEAAPGHVLEFNGVTGAPVGVFGPALSGNIMAIHTGGAVGDVLVGAAFGGVKRLDRNTGAVMQTYN